VKTLAILTAALAISLACAGTASAQTSSVSQTTSTDAFGNQRTVTKRHNADGSESVSRSVTDAFGNKKSITKRQNADGSESVTFTKTKGRI
jgi:hypothetical protein